VPLLLIRHAQAGNRKDWQGDDRLRPLSPKGARQALALVRSVKHRPPARILSSPYTRCIQTVQPLADDLSLKVEDADELAEGSGSKAVALVRSLATHPVALCTHGDIVAEVLIALADEDGLDLGPAPRQAKGSVWVLEARHGKFVTATYVPPRI
jgi:phosphohistidine phosphatase SixA